MDGNLRLFDIRNTKLLATLALLKPIATIVPLHLPVKKSDFEKIEKKRQKSLCVRKSYDVDEVSIYGLCVSLLKRDENSNESNIDSNTGNKAGQIVVLIPKVILYNFIIIINHPNSRLEFPTLIFLH